MGRASVRAGASCEKVPECNCEGAMLREIAA
ncbi:hypothetical protein COLO4_25912 [Corchorus olitorius]|uniref:Uncharacterized protein n=1 Tax=Corchorus olitorius TaxID=93759 RepID=A0A1R3HZE6_9ROSI|nr:hypothetical protein COLO4_25912 [Corchorus olitorius]